MDRPRPCLHDTSAGCLSGHWPWILENEYLPHEHGRFFSDPHRAFGNNYIRTDGQELQILAYDLARLRQPPSRKDCLPRIEKLYPTQRHLIEAFGDDLDSVIVVGIDPGEV
ncbi:hypothetical protein BGZ94_000299, partial [Podila epigama]